MPAKLYDGPRLQQFHGHVLAPISRLVSFPFVMDKLRQVRIARDVISDQLMLISN